MLDIKNTHLHVQALPERIIWGECFEILYWLLDLLQSFEAESLLWAYGNGFHVDKVLETGFRVLFGYMYYAEMREIV
jgi:ferric iron reductase protein FhuF